MAGDLKAGDKVTLNDIGIEGCFGTKLGLSHMKTHVMTVTWVDTESMTDDIPAFIVDVDDPEINCFMLNNHYFDIAQ